MCHISRSFMRGNYSPPPPLGVLPVVPGFSFIGKPLKGQGNLIDQCLTSRLGHLGGRMGDFQWFHEEKDPAPCMFSGHGKMC